MNDKAMKFRDRYFKRKRIEVDCEVITPMFLGNANQEAEWRPEPLKGLFRYWWRILHSALPQVGQTDMRELLHEESALFGFAGDNEAAGSGKSLVGITVLGAEKPCVEKFPFVETIDHPETDRGKIDPLLYLAGIGLMQNGQVKHPYFRPSSCFSFYVDFPEKDSDSINGVLALLQAFGGLGGRSRNGWGSFQVVRGGLEREDVLRVLGEATRNWKDGFDKDYPNCLGKDPKPLLWKTKGKGTWQDAMRELADAYVGVRAREVKGLRSLHPDNGQRHLLGLPLTHHNPQGPGRYSSPLRFSVRKHGSKYFGLAVHLPQRFPSETVKLSREQQLEVWGIVHRKLDVLLNRASYEECL